MILGWSRTPKCQFDDQWSTKGQKRTFRKKPVFTGFHENQCTTISNNFWKKWNTKKPKNPKNTFFTFWRKSGAKSTIFWRGPLFGPPFWSISDPLFDPILCDLGPPQGTFRIWTPLKMDPLFDHFWTSFLTPKMVDFGGTPKTRKHRISWFLTPFWSLFDQIMDPLFDQNRAKSGLKPLKNRPRNRSKSGPKMINFRG